MPEIIPKEAPEPRAALGYDGTDFYVLKVDADGHLQVDCTVLVHGPTHWEGAADELDAGKLASGAAPDGHLLTADGASGAAWEAPIVAAFYNAYVCVRDKKAQNTSGGTFASGAWRVRDINEEIADADNICSIASNQITLAAGTYRCLISAPCFEGGHHQAKLYNVTDTVLVLVGTSETAWLGNGVQTRSIIQGRFTLAAPKALEVQHRCGSTRDDHGFGWAANFGDEIYTVAEFWREE